MDSLFALWKDFEVSHILANAVAKVMKAIYATKEKEVRGGSRERRGVKRGGKREQRESEEAQVAGAFF
jgi:hypothetical protein